MKKSRLNFQTGLIFSELSIQNWTRNVQQLFFRFIHFFRQLNRFVCVNYSTCN